VSGTLDRLLSEARPVAPEDVDAVRLRRQWVISRDVTPPLPSWRRVELNGRYRLWHHPETRTMEAAAPGSLLVVLGVPLVEGGLGALRAELRRVAAGPAEGIAAFLRGVAGTYVLLHATASEVTVYTDPAGMLAAFRGHGRVASTPSLLGPLERDTGLDAAFPFQPGNDWYPGDLTPFLGVRAVRANHALAVEADTSWRFWPVEESPRIDLREAVERLATVLRRNVAATAEQGVAVCSVTGGRDSRVNVAASREHLDEVAFFTLRREGKVTCDMEIAGELARAGGLDHRVVTAAPPPPWLTALYDEMTRGLSIGSRRELIGGVNRLAGPDRIHISGLLGELAQAIYWPVRAPSEVRSRDILKHFLASPPPVTGAFEGWLASVPDLSPATIYNLAYLEQRTGRHASVGETASTLFYDAVTPYCSREVFELICGSPTASQFEGRIPLHLVEEMWPDLAAVPYCPPRRRWTRRFPRRVRSAAKNVRSHLPGRR